MDDLNAIDVSGRLDSGPASRPARRLTHLQTRHPRRMFARFFEEILWPPRGSLPPQGLERVYLRHAARPEDVARSRCSGSKFDRVEVVVEDMRQLLSVPHPVRAQGVVHQAGFLPRDRLLDAGYVDVELMEQKQL